MLKVVQKRGSLSNIYIYIYRLACAIFLIFVLSLIVISGLTFNSSNTSAANSATLDANVNIRDSLTLSITRNGTPTDNVTLNLDPASNPFSYRDLDIAVGTNNETGYKLTMSTLNGNTNLINVSDNTKTIPTLPTLAGGYDDTTFIPNYWGYKKDSGNYIPFVSGVTLLENSGRTNNDATSLRFATKIDYTKESGQYETNLIFTATANPLVYTMQNLDPTLCTTTPRTVIDNRDSQEYIIQRLADDNCWMMTNLNLGATALATDLTNSNTNISSIITATVFNSWRKSSGTNTYTNAELISVAGTDPISQTPYGTLYNYCAVSAGSICGSGNTDATSDLCPAGWRLPTGGTSGEFQNLYSQSAYNSYDKMRAPIQNGGAAFALSGWFTSSTPVNQGSRVRYYSSTSYSDGRMYAIAIDSPNTIDTVNNSSRASGFAARCILK